MTTDWNKTKLGFISSIRYGLGVPPVSSEEGVPMIRATNVKRGRIVSNGLMHVRLEDVPNGRNAILREGEIIVVRSGAYTGDSALVTAEWAGSVAGYDLIVSPNSLVDFAYLSFWLLGETAHRYFRGQRDRSAQPHLNRQQLGDLELTLPPLHEQRKIATVLLAVQRAIEWHERLIALTTELKKAVMHKLFTEGTRGEPLMQTEIGPVPEGWTVEPLGERLVTAQYGLSVKGVADGTTPILRMTNQVEGRIVARNLQMVSISEADHLKFKVVQGDILFNRTNSFELVGRTAIFELDGDFVFASYLIRLRTQVNSLRPAFLNHYFNWSAVQERLKGIASRAVSQSNISASRLRRFLVPLPSPEEQAEIVSCIDEIDRVQAVHYRQLGALQGLFRTLLHQIMNAQVRVHALDLSMLEAAERTQAEARRIPDREDIFAEMRPDMVDIEDLDDTREAVYARGRGDAP